MRDECIEFQGRLDKDGYGVLWKGGKDVKAHRLAYCEHHGIPLDSIASTVIRHKCDNPPCINPHHLEPGTQLDNIRDTMIRGRMNQPKGEAHGMAKLTEDDVRKIRAEYVPGSKEAGTPSLARKYGVTSGMIRFIVKRISWKHVV